MNTFRAPATWLWMGSLLAGCQGMPELHFNEPPIAATLAITPLEPLTTDDLTFEITQPATDPEGDTLTESFQWTLNGEAAPGVVTTVDASETQKGQVWEIRAVANDGEWASEAGTASVTILNTPPVWVTTALTPAAPASDEDLALDLVGEDADGDALDYLVTWLQDGEVVADLEDLLTVPASRVGAHETWTALVTLSDGEEESEEVLLSTYVDNTPPSITAVEITSSELTVDATIVAYALNRTDVDGHDVDVTFEWYVEGTLVLEDTNDTGASFLSNAFVKHEEVYVLATPSDGWSYGTTFTSDVVTIANTPPLFTAVDINPLAATEATTLTCTPSGGTDADGDVLEYRYHWWAGGAGGAGDSSVDGDDFDAGDEVYCEVTVHDGEEDGNTLESARVDVDNTPPEVTAATLSTSEPTEASGITVAVSSVDVDGDTVTYKYQWTVAGAAVSVTSKNLTGSSYARGDEVFVIVTPNDGTDDGAPFSSAVVTVQNTLPSLSSVGVSPGTIYADSTPFATASGWSDDDGDSAAYTYQWYVNGAEVSGATARDLSASYIERGDTVYITATPYDSYGSGTPVSSSTYTVRNSAPDPVAALLTGSSAFACDEIQLDASGSSDEDGDTLTYSWQLSSSPSDSRQSTSDIVETTDEQPLFIVDAKGTFRFEVTASDGTAGASDSVDLAVTLRKENEDPVSEAGEDLTASGIATCSSTGTGYRCETCTGDSFDLDGSASYDNDGDDLNYTWSTSSSYATIDDKSSATPQVTLKNLPAAYGGATTTTVSIKLRVDDCTGGWDEDYIVIEFDCEGV